MHKSCNSMPAIMPDPAALNKHLLAKNKLTLYSKLFWIYDVCSIQSHMCTYIAKNDCWYFNRQNKITTEFTKGRNTSKSGYPPPP